MNKISKICATEKVKKTVNHLMEAVSLASAALYVNCNAILCANDRGSSGGGKGDDLFTGQDVTVNVGAMNTNTLVGRVVGVLTVICVIIGMFMIFSGVAKYLSATSEGNAAEQSKAGKTIAVGAAFASMGAIARFIFG
jgi:hypothetical protein